MASKLFDGCAKLKSKDGEFDVAELDKCDVVGLYFSAHWCPPCRGFTPVLSKAFTDISGAGKSFQIVFLSSDRDEGSFNDYHKEMSFLALPFAESDIKEALSTKYSISGIPTLILVDGKTGEMITADGRGKISGDPKGENFPWK